VRDLSNSMRCVTVLLVAMLMLFTSNNVALAKLSSRATKQQTVTTPQWGNVIVDAGASVSTNPYSFAWQEGIGLEITYVDLRNSGNISTTGTLLTVTTQDQNESRKDASSLTLSACTGGTWNQTSNACSGTVTALGTVTNGSITLNLALAAGAISTIRVAEVQTKRAKWTSTLSVKVTRSQIRAATVTNS